MFYIYAIVFPNGKRYVGATRDVRRRATEHRYALNSKTGHYNAQMQALWAQYKTFEVVELYAGQGGESAAFEQAYIDSLIPEQRLNVARAGKRNKGRMPSAGQLAAMKAGRLKSATDAQRQRMSLAKLGTGRPVVNKTTGERFANCRCAAESVGKSYAALRSAVTTGRPKTVGGYIWRYEGAPDFVYGPRKKKGKLTRPVRMTPEGLKKRAAATRAAKSKPVLNLDTGEIYPSAVAAANAVGAAPGNISGAISGRYKTIAGFRWARANITN